MATHLTSQPLLQKAQRWHTQTQCINALHACIFIYCLSSVAVSHNFLSRLVSIFSLPRIYLSSLLYFCLLIDSWLFFLFSPRSLVTVCRQWRRFSYTCRRQFYTEGDGRMNRTDFHLFSELVRKYIYIGFVSDWQEKWCFHNARIFNFQK